MNEPGAPPAPRRLIAVQKIAAEVVDGVLRGASLSSLLGSPQRHRLDAWQRAAVQDAAYGTLRHLGSLRADLSQLVRQPLRQSILESLLLVAIYQLQHSRAAPHAVVDNAVGCATAIGAGAAKGLVNAVLRAFLRDRDQIVERSRATEEGRFSYPAWWIEKLRLQYPTNWAAILEAGNEHPPFTLRVRLNRITLEACLKMLEQAGLEARQTGPAALTLAHPVPVSELPGFAEGLVSVQDGGAQLAAPLLEVRDGQRVLDACAAPGGKATHILELAAVQLVALDREGPRLQQIGENLTRLGLTAEVIRGDAAILSEWWDGRPFDRILADVPCSASGVVRRHPDVKWLRRPRDVLAFAANQSSLLDALWQTLTRGGKLLYVTCSVFREENHEQADRFLTRHSDACRVPVSALPEDGTLLPDHAHDGFFYALFEKD